MVRVLPDLSTEALSYRMALKYYSTTRDAKPDFMAIKIKGTFSDPEVGIDSTRVKEFYFGEKKAELEAKKAAVKAQLAAEKAALKKKLDVENRRKELETQKTS